MFHSELTESLKRVKTSPTKPKCGSASLAINPMSFMSHKTFALKNLTRASRSIFTLGKSLRLKALLTLLLVNNYLFHFKYYFTHICPDNNSLNHKKRVIL